MVFVVKLYCNLQFEAKRFKSFCCCLPNKRTHKKCKKKRKHFTNKSHLKLHFHNSILGGNPSARKIIILLRKDLSFLHPNELSRGDSSFVNNKMDSLKHIKRGIGIKFRKFLLTNQLKLIYLLKLKYYRKIISQLKIMSIT